MPTLTLFTTMFAYGDWANDALLAAAATLDEPHLDQPFDIGPGSARRILAHIDTGESVWLNRWRGHAQTPWSSAPDTTLPNLRARFLATRAARFDFLATLDPARLDFEQTYRDSRGSMFRAKLVDMLLQGFVHSAHHRAQAVNVLRRLGAGVVELDYMMHVRQPA